MTWKCFPNYLPFVRGIHRSTVDSHNWEPVIRSYVIFWTACLDKNTVGLSLIGDAMALIWSHIDFRIVQSNRLVWWLVIIIMSNVTISSSKPVAIVWFLLPCIFAFAFCFSIDNQLGHKFKIRHGLQFVVTGGTQGRRYDNRWYRKRRQTWHHQESWFSV